MSGLVEFTKNELKLLEDHCVDEEGLQLQKTVDEDIMKIVNVFCTQGHSGTSADYVLNVLDRILRYKPVTPLTGEDDEWEDLDELMIGNGEPKYQNKRCPSVFKTSEGRAYWTEGKIFSEDNGHTWFTSKDSIVDIEFPFMVPDYSENIIIDNVSKRYEIQKSFVELLKQNNLYNVDTNNMKDLENDELKISEDTELIAYIKDFDKVNELLKETYNIDRLLYNLSEKDYTWNAINVIMDAMENSSAR